MSGSPRRAVRVPPALLTYISLRYAIPKGESTDMRRKTHGTRLVQDMKTAFRVGSKQTCCRSTERNDNARCPHTRGHHT